MAALGVRINWRIRIRAPVHAISWSATAIVLGLAVAPAPLVVLTTGTGVAIALLSMKPSPLKTAFGVAKSMLLAAGGGVALHTLGRSPQDTDLRHVIGIDRARLRRRDVVLDELLTLPVIAMATRTPLRRLFWDDLGLRLTSALARFVLIAVTLIVLQADPRLLLAVPPLVLSLAPALFQPGQVPDRAAGLAAPRPHHRRAQRGRPRQRSSPPPSPRPPSCSPPTRSRSSCATPAAPCAGPAGTASPTTAPPARPSAIERHRSCPPGWRATTGRPTSGCCACGSAARSSSTSASSTRCAPSPPRCAPPIRNAPAYAELARVADEHAHAAAHDPLTGLANRRQLLRPGRRAARRPARRRA